MRTSLHFIALVAALQLLASAAPAASYSSIDTATLYIVYTHGTSFTFPNLVPAGTVDMAVYSTANQPEVTDLPTILKERETEYGGDDPSLPVVTAMVVHDLPIWP